MRCEILQTDKGHSHEHFAEEKESKRAKIGWNRELQRLI